MVNQCNIKIIRNPVPAKQENKTAPYLLRAFETLARKKFYHLNRVI